MSSPAPSSPAAHSSPSTGPYRVQLDAYAGPLDLLLHLVKQHEIDLHDIPIATLTEQYLSHLDAMARPSTEGTAEGKTTLDVDRAGEFLVMAATLVEIKSSLLMPRIQAAEDDAQDELGEAGDPTDPRFELVQQLLAYKRFKDAAMHLEERRTEWEERFPAGARATKPPATSPEDDAQDSSPVVELDLEDIGVNDLCSAFSRLLDSIGFVGDHQVTYDETPLSLHADDIADRLLRDGKPDGPHATHPGMTLRELFIGRKNRSEMIGLFLATLELVRQRRVRVMQPPAGGDIRLVLRPEADRNDLENESQTSLKPTSDIPQNDLAAYDWPDDATRKRVERRMRLRAAHQERAQEEQQKESQEDQAPDQSASDLTDDSSDAGASQPLPLPGSNRADPSAADPA
ncbi:MAG: segregation/condensation protein A [Algisphaera sp.]